MKITAKEIIEKIDEALKQFGEYNYEDKGAREVMDLGEIAKRLKEMDASEIVAVLTEVEKNHRYPEPFLRDIISSLDNWEDPRTNEIFESDLFQRHY